MSKNPFTTPLAIAIFCLFFAATFGMLVYITIVIVQTRAPITTIPISDKQELLNCQVLIIGSGFAGSYAAYRLAPQLHTNLCLIEGQHRDGGRIYDISESSTNKIDVFGAGALRITSGQRDMLKLGEELGIELQQAFEHAELLKVRGKYFFLGKNRTESQTTEMCEELFPGMYSCYPNSTQSTESVMLGHLMRLPSDVIEKHSDFPTLILSEFGEEGLAFLRETVYNSAISSISSQALLDFFGKETGPEMGLNPVRHYPVGGMSEFIRKMIGNATNNGMRIFRGEPVVRIQRSGDGSITVDTPRLRVVAGKVLSSIDPVGFKNVTGNVAEMVKAAPEFQAILPKAVAVVNVWWNDRWWEMSQFNSNRTLERVISHANCFNAMEIPMYDYAAKQNVTRAVYDDGACLDLWRMLIPDGGECDSPVLINEVVNSLQLFFTDVPIPRPRKLCGYYHENGWSFQNPKSRLTNQQIFAWSHRPVPMADNFALIGEAYNLNYSGWCDAALRSTRSVLAKSYNFTYSNAETESQTAKIGAARKVFSMRNILP